jgi:DHA3 family macrolide efflux protein-like MFS transporter
MTPRRGTEIFHGLLVGVVLALLGDQLSGFALGVWLFQRTGLVSSNGVLAVATTLPFIACAPLAGVLVDRLGPGRVLWMGAAGANLCAFALLSLERAGRLDAWTAALLVGLATALRSGEFGAISALTTTLLPSARWPRANGLVQLAFALPQLVSPLAAGYLLSAVGIRAILAAYAASATAATAVFAGLRPRGPSPAARASLLEEVATAWRYIRERGGLVALLAFFAAVNFDLGVVQVIVTPLVLGFAGPRELGVVLSVGGVGAIVGSVAMSVWSGPRRRVAAILAATALQGLALLLGGLRPSTWLVALAAFGVMLTFPVIAVSCQVVWQKKVPVHLQGRIASFRVVVAGATVPLACAIAGPLGDRVFEPAMRTGGSLAGVLQRIVGAGEGRGVAVLMASLGVATVLVAVAGSFSRVLQRVETDLPDQEPDDRDDGAPLGIERRAS